MKIENIDEGQRMAQAAYSKWHEVAQFLHHNGHFGSIDISEMTTEQKQAANAIYEAKRDAAFAASQEFKDCDEEE